MASFWSPHPGFGRPSQAEMPGIRRKTVINRTKEYNACLPIVNSLELGSRATGAQLDAVASPFPVIKGQNVLSIYDHVSLVRSTLVAA